MYKGITPTITLTLPEDVDLTGADVYVTFASRGYSVQKSMDELKIRANTINVYLTQEETLGFPSGAAALQVNWTYDDAGVKKRACSTIERISFADNLIDGVI